MSLEVEIFKHAGMFISLVHLRDSLKVVFFQDVRIALLP